MRRAFKAFVVFCGESDQRFRSVYSLRQISIGGDG